MSVHPLIVHFPIALLLSAACLDGIAWVLRRPGIHAVALWNLSLGTLGAAAAVATGLRAEAVAKHSFEIWQVMELHKRLGFFTLGLGALVTGWRLLRRDRLTVRTRAALFVLTLIVVGTVSWGAYLGGRMVYEFGVGGVAHRG